MKTKDINWPVVIEKFDKILKRGLCTGVGTPDGQMCIEAAVTQAMDLPFNDEPKCVLAAVRDYKITINDLHYWKSPKSRAKALRDIGIAQIGSNGVVRTDDFARLLVKKHIQVLIPTLVREFYPRDKKMLDLAAVCERDGDKKSFKQLCHHLPLYKLADTIFCTLGIWDHASNANIKVVKCANIARYAQRTQKTQNEKYLKLSIRLAMETLRELKSPGCEWV